MGPIISSWSNSVVGIILITVLTWISINKRWLKPSGVLGLLIISTTLFFYGNIVWFLVFFCFLASASLATLYKSENKKYLDEIVEKTGPRDIFQALANVGFPTMLAIVYYFDHQKIWIIGFLCAIASVTADTWATELGSISKKWPVLITDWKRPVSPGTSGGITPQGTVSGMAGSFYIAFVGVGLFNFYSGSVDFTNTLLSVFIVAIAGWAGLFVDSLLGATLQVSYKCDICGISTEKKIDKNKHKTHYSKGIHWISNDWVNFMASVFGGTIGMLVAWWLQTLIV